MRHLGPQLPNQGSILVPLYWKADSQPLDLQGSPSTLYSFLFHVLYLFSLIAPPLMKSELHSYSIHLFTYIIYMCALYAVGFFFFFFGCARMVVTF